VKTEITYFKVAGAQNTGETLRLAKEKALERGIKRIVIASIRGKTVPAALEVFKQSDLEVYFASCDACNGCPRFDPEMKSQLEEAGHRLIFANENAYPYPPEAELAYRRICEGMKVVVHLAIAVVEEGIIPSGEEIIAIAGTGWKGYDEGGGSDTAVIIETAGAKEYWSYQPLSEHKKKGRRIKEIICMPG
jgi:hypothetical protein